MRSSCLHAPSSASQTVDAGCKVPAGPAGSSGQAPPLPPPPPWPPRSMGPPSPSRPAPKLPQRPHRMSGGGRMTPMARVCVSTVGKAVLACPTATMAPPPFSMVLGCCYSARSCSESSINKRPACCRSCLSPTVHRLHTLPSFRDAEAGGAERCSRAQHASAASFGVFISRLNLTLA